MMLEKLDDYLSSHYVEARLPETIIGSDIVPRSLIDNVPRSVSVPLTDSPNGQGKVKAKFKISFIYSFSNMPKIEKFNF